MRVLIAGCGDVGSALGQMLRKRGDEVWGLRRHVSVLPSVIHPLQADLSDPLTLTQLPTNLDAVCYTVAATGHNETAYKAAYIDGVENMFWALQRAGQSPRFLFVSSTSVYGHDKGEWVDEDSDTNPNRFSGRLMLEGEALVRGYSGESSAIRFGGIYGPGRNRLIELVRAGASCQGDPPLYTNRIHRDDCVGALVRLLDLESPASIYVGVDSHPAQQCKIMGWLAKKLGVPDPDHIAGSSIGKRCRNRRLLETGYRLLYPTFREGYEAVLGDKSP